MSDALTAQVMRRIAWATLSVQLPCLACGGGAVLESEDVRELGCSFFCPEITTPNSNLGASGGPPYLAPGIKGAMFSTLWGFHPRHHILQFVDRTQKILPRCFDHRCLGFLITVLVG